MNVLRLVAAGILAAAVSQQVTASPYTANSPLCGPSGTAQTCKINLADFMKSQFNWTAGGKTYTSDSTNLYAAANSANTSSFRYIPKNGSIAYDYASDTRQVAASDITIKQGFMVHPRFPNVLLHSKTGTNTIGGGALEIFRSAPGNDNAMYVLSEPYDAGGWKSFDQRELAQGMHWINRGYFWADMEFDVTRNPAKPTEWVSATREWSGSDHDDIAASGAKTGVTLVGPKNSVIIRYYPAENGAWINTGGGQLPNTPLEILQITLHQHLDGGGPVFWWETFDYARQKKSDGSYNYFGLIRFQSSLDYRNTTFAKCENGMPPAGHANGECGYFNMLLYSKGHYNGFTNALDAAQNSTVRNWYETALLPAYKAKNDPKLTKRVVGAATAENPFPADTPQLPHNRGGFVPPGSGNDAKGVFFGGSSTAPPGEMLYLENTTVEQDWYIYPNGRDPLFAPAASPTNYCRDGYKYLASMPVSRSYNGLNATVESGAAHWMIVCGTSTDAYFQGSNGGSDASCAPGYVSRGWFAKPTTLSMTTCLPNGTCVDATPNAFVNMCVSQNETIFTYPAPHP